MAAPAAATGAETPQQRLALAGAQVQSLAAAAGSSVTSRMPSALPSTGEPVVPLVLLAAAGLVAAGIGLRRLGRRA
jgi:LPXTG-motif cell wall-anchored protein